MIYVDKKYDIILTFSPIIEITGHIFECFDYWLILRKKYKVGILFLAGLSLEKLEIAWNSKYNVSFQEVKENIIIINDSEYHGAHIYKFDKHTLVFLCDGNIRALNDRKIIFSCNKMIGFLCGNHHFEQIKMNSNIIYLQDDRIYGKNQFFRSFNYIKKLPFKYYKKSIKKSNNIGMMYITYACRKVTAKIIEEYHKKSKCSKTILVVPYKISEYNNIKNVEQIVAPVENFFDKFDTYIYTPVERHFDCSPRLVTECFMQGKKVLLDLDYDDIGLQTRYYDCVNKLDSLDLTENDQIFQIIEQIIHE